MEEDRKALRGDFDEAVNMTPAELERWLGTDESSEVGWGHEDDGASVGHESGRKIGSIKRQTVDELRDNDYPHMRKVVGFVRRHEAQGGPERDVEHSPWRYSLMNWGRDPLK